MADRRLQVFQAVAKHASFTRAADALFMSQPAVTFQVRQLEEQYRVRLFERKLGNVSLTPAGELVLSYADRILALSDELDGRVAELTDAMRGPLLVGACPAVGDYLLPAWLGEFNARYPRVTARLAVAASRDIERRVEEHALDVGLIGATPGLPGLDGEPCGDEELVAVCAPGYPLAAKGAVRAKALADHEYIAHAPGSGTREAGDACFRAHRVDPAQLKTVMELGSLEALKRVVASGLGFAIVSRAAVMEEVEAGRLAATPFDPPLRREFWLVAPEGRFRSRLVAGFMQFVKQKMKEAHP